MNKSQFYLSECAEVASKSPMCFKLGAIMVKGGKVISTGYNHHRTHYDGSELKTHGHRKPVSMHAEMHAIFNATGMTPSFKTQGLKNHQHLENKQQMNKSQAQSTLSHTSRRRVLRTHGGVFYEPDEPGHPQEFKNKKKLKKKHESRTLSPSCGSSADGSGLESSGGNSPRRQLITSPDASVYLAADITRTGWSSRSRDMKINGADIYIVRITKTGCGNAHPCWRCLEWCRWAGVKRIFHWNEETNQFDKVMVNSADLGQYETAADFRFFAGLRPLCLAPPPTASRSIMPTDGEVTSAGEYQSQSNGHLIGHISKHISMRYGFLQCLHVDAASSDLDTKGFNELAAYAPPDGKRYRSRSRRCRPYRNVIILRKAGDNEKRLAPSILWFMLPLSVVQVSPSVDGAASRRRRFKPSSRR
ncbi:hypothetical protein SCHPADRAFT_886753 [Schizopora paradoxa]|uniref:CMP/dCMP-type deaminase domain-containing protein n=1 Tax=Schizopora paradoxa TaxID=27342 RepID=A0A0H2S079_9AGAM|nr:hypothetical protein SCHPADRAFT_886753 [Schizopora paradoxa]